LARLLSYLSLKISFKRQAGPNSCFFLTPWGMGP